MGADIASERPVAFGTCGGACSTRRARMTTHRQQDPTVSNKSPGRCFLLRLAVRLSRYATARVSRLDDGGIADVHDMPGSVRLAQAC
jgi:hypothetical protein